MLCFDRYVFLFDKVLLMCKARVNISLSIIKTDYLSLGMWWSQPKSASGGSALGGCGFHVQNLSGADVDLLRDQN